MFSGWGQCKILLTLGFFAVALGCAKSSKTNSISKNGVQIYDFSSRKEALDQYSKWKVECADIESCPDTVGQLVVLEGKSLSLCTATLVDEDVILTSSHCFDVLDDQEKHYLSEDDICKNGASVIFASNSPSGHDVAVCEKVIKKSYLGETGSRPDYMLLKLSKKLQRGFHQVVRTGMANKQVFKFHKVNPKGVGLGELETRKCEVMHATAILPQAQDDLFYLHVLKGCEAVPGNSGGSLIDEDGKIHGVVFAGILKDKSFQEQSVINKKIHAKSIKLKIAMATNASCIDYNFLGATDYNLQRCLDDMKAEARIEDLIDRSEFLRKVRSRMESNLSSQAGFGYELHHKRGQLMAFYAPYCFLGSAMSPIKHETVNASVIYWDAEYDVNDYLQPTLNVKSKDYSCKISWSPSELVVFKKAQVTLSGSMCFDSRGNRTSGKDTWKLCEP